MPGLHHLRRGRPAWFAGCLVMASGVLGACAGHRPPGMADRFVRGADGYVKVDLPPEAGAVGSPAERPRSIPPSPKTSEVPTVETSDAGLAATLARLRAEPTVESLRSVAADYQRLGIFDQALEYFSEALAIKSRDAASYAGRARVWRDWGQPDMALADAHRAVYFAPGSADAYNTLGTVFFALGQFNEATAAFTKALAIDPDAAWVQSNLCYVSLMAGDEAAALQRCAAAIEAAPDLAVARNNLALVHASAGRIDEARMAFLATGDRPTALYNMGIVFMARREYAAAAEAFDAAYQARPSFDEAWRRASQARELARRSAGGK